MTPKGKPPLAAVLRELWAGIDAANAIRHGLPVPDAARAPAAGRGRLPAVGRAVRDRVTVRKGVVPFH
ncbi:MAG: hypothetical protein M3165_00475 [Actinomycetota bacterium]|nr:hypothetical protein [Actinomycetota bacterium]